MNRSIINMGGAAVIDDHPLVSNGIAQYLTSNCGFHQAFTFQSIREFLASPKENLEKISLIVIDYWINSRSASSLIRQLTAQHPYLRVLVISADDNPSVLTSAREAGAHGFIGKQASHTDFFKAVQTLMQFRSYFPDERQEYSRMKDHLKNTYSLSNRQSDVLVLAIRGWSNKRIATELTISESTVKEHMSAILAKIGVTNRVEALALVSRLCHE